MNKLKQLSLALLLGAMLLGAPTARAYEDGHFSALPVTEAAGVTTRITDARGDVHRLPGALDAAALAASPEAADVASYTLEQNGTPLMTVEPREVFSQAPEETGGDSAVTTGGYYALTLNLKQFNGETGDYEVFLTGLSQAHVSAVEKALTEAVLTERPFDIFDAKQLPFIDAEKFSVENYPEEPVRQDANMCWAAATSNMLWYTGWAQKAAADRSLPIQSEDDVLDLFVQAFKDLGGNGYCGTQWFFNGTWAFYDGDSSKGPMYDNDYHYDRFAGFLPAYGAEKYLESFVVQRRPQDIRRVCDLLKAGRGATVSIGWYDESDKNYDKRNGGHAVTLWGYVRDAAEASADRGAFTQADKAKYKAIIISDSDTDTLDALGNVNWHLSQRSDAPDRLRIAPIIPINDVSGSDGWIINYDYLESDKKIDTGHLEAFSMLKPYDPNTDLPEAASAGITLNSVTTPDLTVNNIAISDDDCDTDTDPSNRRAFGVVTNAEDAGKNGKSVELYCNVSLYNCGHVATTEEAEKLVAYSVSLARLDANGAWQTVPLPGEDGPLDAAYGTFDGTLGSLKATTSYTRIYFGSLEPGEYQVTVTANPTGDFKEARRDNNVDTLRFSVVDTPVQSFELSLPESINVDFKDGATLTFTDLLPARRYYVSETYLTSANPDKYADYTYDSATGLSYRDVSKAEAALKASGAKTFVRILEAPDTYDAPFVRESCLTTLAYEYFRADAAQNAKNLITSQDGKTVSAGTVAVDVINESVNLSGSRPYELQLYAVPEGDTGEHFLMIANPDKGSLGENKYDTVTYGGGDDAWVMRTDSESPLAEGAYRVVADVLFGEDLKYRSSETVGKLVVGRGAASQNKAALVSGASDIKDAARSPWFVEAVAEARFAEETSFRLGVLYTDNPEADWSKLAQNADFYTYETYYGAYAEKDLSFDYFTTEQTTVYYRAAAAYEDENGARQFLLGEIRESQVPGASPVKADYVTFGSNSLNSTGIFIYEPKQTGSFFAYVSDESLALSLWENGAWVPLPVNDRLIAASSGDAFVLRVRSAETLTPSGYLANAETAATEEDYTLSVGLTGILTGKIPAAADGTLPAEDNASIRWSARISNDGKDLVLTVKPQHFGALDKNRPVWAAGYSRQGQLLQLFRLDPEKTQAAFRDTVETIKLFWTESGMRPNSSAEEALVPAWKEAANTPAQQ